MTIVFRGRRRRPQTMHFHSRGRLGSGQTCLVDPPCRHGTKRSTPSNNSSVTCVPPLVGEEILGMPCAVDEEEMTAAAEWFHNNNLFASSLPSRRPITPFLLLLLWAFYHRMM